MKKTPLIIGCIALALCVICLLAGALLSVPKINNDNNTEDPTFNFTPPTDPPPVGESLKTGTYYLIAGTNVQHYLQRHDLKDCIVYDHMWLEFLDSGEVKVWRRSNRDGEWNEKAGVITLSRPETILEGYNWEFEHDKEWLDKYQPQEYKEFTCVYDSETEIITVRYGIETLTFKYFESADAVTTWLQEYIPEQGGIFMPSYYSDYESLPKYSGDDEPTTDVN